MKNTFTRILIVCLGALAMPVLASQVRQLTWDDLVPEFNFEDPFEVLTDDQLAALGFVARIRGELAADKTVSAATQKEAAEMEQELVSAGIDIDDLLARREEIRKLREKRGTSVVSNLDGESIKMPGFVLPLEYSGRKVTEFLLVPWVGACIHTPPPPPNQIVHVVLNEQDAFESKGMFEPVWVAGQMTTEASSLNLYLKDGSDDFNIAYRLQASLVEPYKK